MQSKEHSWRGDIKVIIRGARGGGDNPMLY